MDKNEANKKQILYNKEKKSESEWIGDKLKKRVKLNDNAKLI